MTCTAKTLPQLWGDDKFKAKVKAKRDQLQELVNRWCTRDHKRHLPVYLSLKPKIKLYGLYFEKTRGNGAITIFIIRTHSFPVTSFTVYSDEGIMKTLEHEYSHHLTGTAHGANFKGNLDKVRKANSRR